MITDRNSRIAAFARGFFLDLDEHGIRSAILHGARDGFESGVSDIDFAVGHKDFRRLTAIIHRSCQAAGWRLCQILRHETTAAYFVCSAADDPTCAVALDACSDYQRNGTIFLPVEELLEKRKPFPWGGHGLSPTTELRYRFAKAAAKNKDAATCIIEFSAYSDEARQECSAWLQERWGISLKSWDAAELVPVLAQIRTVSNHRPTLLQAGAIRRIICRILNPTGLVVIAGHNDFDATATRLDGVYGHLYFRSFRKCLRWKPTMLKDLISSTLIVVPELGKFWTHVLPADCVHRMLKGENCQAIARHLHQRCKTR